MNNPHRHPRVPSPVWAALAFAAAFLPGTARAANTTCAHDSDCLKGYVCQTGTETACPDIACDPADPNCTPPDCTPHTYSACILAPCAADSDCGPGMACVTQPVNCAVTEPACPPGAECAEPAAVDSGCDPNPQKQCTPKYLLPCHADSDCGQGFSCVADEACGSAGYDPTSGEPPPAAQDGGSQVTCMTLSTSSCQLQTIACTTNTDCPTAWSCAAPDDGAVSCSSNGSGTSDCTSVPATSPKQCLPPYSSYGGDTFGEGTSGSAAPVSAGDPQGTDTQNGGGATKGTGPAASSGGCQMGGGLGGSGAAWAALFGLAALVRRRRSA